MSCLRCGRKAKASFCDECLKLVSMPLPDSPYLNTQINLKAKKTARPAVAVKAKEEKKTSSRKGCIVAIVVLSVLCAVLLCACLWFGRKEIFQWLS